MRRGVGWGESGRGRWGERGREGREGGTEEGVLSGRGIPLEGAAGGGLDREGSRSHLPHPPSPSSPATTPYPAQLAPQLDP